MIDDDKEAFRRLAEARLKERNMPEEPEVQMTLGEEPAQVLAPEPAPVPSQSLQLLAAEARTTALANRAILTRRAGWRGFFAGIAVMASLWWWFSDSTSFWVDQRGQFWGRNGGVTVGPAASIEMAVSMAVTVQSNRWITAPKLKAK